MELPIDTDRLGIVSTGHVEPVFPWVEGPDGKRRPGSEQERDEATGLPLWVVHGMVPTGERPTLVAVRTPARQAPQVTPLAPVGFERLQATARVNRNTGQLAVYWQAAGVAEARPAGGPHKTAQEAA